ncbi:hypothetical protein BSKO_11732 [Bryopsis sp. KO-2023]|nr:hypothetical protein BSKO_11732 [Bryopsis sp. KO-2023]
MLESSFRGQPSFRNQDLNKLVPTAVHPRAHSNCWHESLSPFEGKIAEFTSCHVIYHDKFNFRKPNDGFDIALVQLSRSSDEVPCKVEEKDMVELEHNGRSKRGMGECKLKSNCNRRIPLPPDLIVSCGQKLENYFIFTKETVECDTVRAKPKADNVREERGGLQDIKYSSNIH